MPSDPVARLLSRTHLRVRLQRFFEALTTALAPALVLVCGLVAAAKTGWLAPGPTRTWVVGVLGLVLLVAIVAALWPISHLATLIRLDRSNHFSDRLSSAYSFSLLPADRRTPEMEAHIRRTGELAGQVRVTAAQPLRFPRNLLPALLMVAVLAFVVSIPELTDPPSLPVQVVELEPSWIIDRGLLLENQRQVDQLSALAERSEDETLMDVSVELQTLVERLRQGTVDEESLLDQLDAIDSRLADHVPPDPTGLDAVWPDLEETIEEAVGESSLPDEVSRLVESLEQPDEGELARAIEQLGELLEEEQLDPDLERELASLLEELADTIDPTDPGIRQAIEEHEQEIREIEERLERRDSNRDRRRLDQALERLARARDDMQGQVDGMAREDSVRRQISDALHEAAGALDGGDEGTGEQATSEPAASQPAEPQPAPGESQPAPAEPQPGTTEVAAEGQQPLQEQSAGAEEPRQTASSGAQRATASLEQASASLRQMDQEQASSEAHEQAQEVSQGLRENLQRSSQPSSTDEGEEIAEATWESFIERAAGRPADQRAAPDGSENAGEPEEAAEPAQSLAQQVGEPGEEPGTTPGEQGDEQQGTYGSGEGGDATQGEATELDSTRIAVEAGTDGAGEEAGQQLSTAQVFEVAARDGFATRAYREVYVEYARAAEMALEAEEIPVGFQGFVRRYFQLVEPR